MAFLRGLFRGLALSRALQVGVRRLLFLHAAHLLVSVKATELELVHGKFVFGGQIRRVALLSALLPQLVGRIARVGRRELQQAVLVVHPDDLDLLLPSQDLSEGVHKVDRLGRLHMMMILLTHQREIAREKNQLVPCLLQLRLARGKQLRLHRHDHRDVEHVDCVHLRLELTRRPHQRVVHIVLRQRLFPERVQITQIYSSVTRTTHPAAPAPVASPAAASRCRS